MEFNGLKWPINDERKQSMSDFTLSTPSVYNAFTANTSHVNQPIIMEGDDFLWVDYDRDPPENLYGLSYGIVNLVNDALSNKNKHGITKSMIESGFTCTVCFDETGFQRFTEMELRDSLKEYVGDNPRNLCTVTFQPVYTDDDEFNSEIPFYILCNTQHISMCASGALFKHKHEELFPFPDMLHWSPLE